MAVGILKQRSVAWIAVAAFVALPFGAVTSASALDDPVDALLGSQAEPIAADLDPDPVPTEGASPAAGPDSDPAATPDQEPSLQPDDEVPQTIREDGVQAQDNLLGSAAAASEVSYLSVPFSPDIYLVTDDEARAVTFDEWDAAGRPQPAPFLSAAYQRVTWSSSIFAVLDWRGDDSLVTSRHLTFAEWERAGRPTPEVVGEVPGSVYLRFRTSPEAERFVRTPDGAHHRLSDGEWTALGRPVVRIEALGFYKAPWAADIYAVSDTSRTHVTAADMAMYGNPTWALAPVAYVRHSWSSALYGVVSWVPGDVEAHHLTPGEWNAIGRPRADVVGRVPGTSYFRWATSDQVFAFSPDRAVHHLTPAEYLAAGSPAFGVRANQGLLRLTWDDTIWMMEDLALGQGRRITPEEYAGLDHPAPGLVTRMIGDQFTRDWGTADVFYSVLGRTWRLAYWQWVAAGSPPPTTTYPPLFTYGTLRHGQPSYQTYLAGKTTSEVGDSIDGLSLYYSASRTFPYAVPGGSGVIGERMDLRTDVYGSTIAGTDAYERYDPALPPDNQAYVREVWTTRAGVRSWIYVAGPRQAAYVRANFAWIPSGDWLRR